MSYIGDEVDMDDNMQKYEMKLLEHLDELRSKLINIMLAFMVSLASSLIFVKDIYNWLVRDLEERLVILGPSDILWVYMMISFVVAVAITIPLAAFQTWRFVAPALNRHEKRVTLFYIPALFILFLIGISFGYFLLFPIVLSFLTTLSTEQFETMFTAEKYFRFMFNLTLPLGLLFEMPVVVIFLTRLGVLNPYRLSKARKLSYFVLITASVIITPPDVVSDILVIIPLLTLFEISISLSKRVYKKRQSA